MIKTVTDIFPIAGGAAGAVGGMIEDASTRVFNIKSILIYVGLTIVGALVGYLVKAILDVFDLQGRIKRLKNQLKIFDKKK